MPIDGRLAELYGRRPVLLVSVAVFVGGSVLAAISPGMPALIAARVVQGLGGGPRVISLAVVGDILPPLGGLFVEYLSWSWIFWINLRSARRPSPSPVSSSAACRSPASGRRSTGGRR
jgi:hypothetical protein